MTEDTNRDAGEPYRPMEDWIWCYEDEAVLAPPEWLGALSELRTA